MKKAPVVTIKGKVVSAQQVAAFSKTFANQSGIITVWANYCAIHAAVHFNAGPLNKMLENAAFRLKSGKLSKLGGEVVSYIRAHVPQIHLKKETGQYVVARMKEDNPQYKRFANPAKLDDNGKPTIVEAGDFALSFDDWRNLEKEPKEPAVKPLKAATVAGQIGKAFEALKAGSFAADYESAKTLLQSVMDFQAELVSFAAGLEPEPESVDSGKVAELLKSGQSGKSTRAGGKKEAV